MQLRKLGNSELRVSAIGFGCWGIAGGARWGRTDESESISAIRTAVDSGVNFFDTAEAYGAGYSEEVLGKALAGRRDRAVVATKTLPDKADRHAITAACERSLARLSMEVIDLYQLHWPLPDAHDEVAEAFVSLRDSGKIRYCGVSNFGPVDLTPYPEDLFASNQVAYNLLFRACEYAVIPETSRRGMSTVAYSSLLHGILAGEIRTAEDVPVGRARTRHFSAERDQARHGEPGHEELTFTTLGELRTTAKEAGIPLREMAVRWLISRSEVTSVLVGSRSSDQARTNAEMASAGLAPDLCAELDRITEPLKRAMGPNPDLWQSESRVRW
jgi:aryl-alcohol dehydrogenase-like predicted oxidoreductase